VFKDLGPAFQLEIEEQFEESGNKDVLVHALPADGHRGKLNL
jgi:hypothetical protein